MRHSVARTMCAVLLFSVFVLPVSLFGQTHNSKKATSSGKAIPEITVQTTEGLAIRANAHIKKERRTQSGAQTGSDAGASNPDLSRLRVTSRPREDRLRRGHAFHGDVRALPQIPPQRFERPEREDPESRPTTAPGTVETTSSQQTASALTPPSPSAPAPATTNNFDGLDFATWGAGHPPDTNGDVGPTYYIQTINTSVGIFRKSDNVRVAAFTFNTLMSQGSFGNLCDTNNFGDPVVLYDTFEDRWIITDFAFTLDGSGNVINPPGTFQCFAVSKTGDPVVGGWNFYSISIVGGLGDYPKFGIWPDGLYMTASIFGYPAGAPFQNPRVWALNKAQMYAGAPSVQVVTFDAPAADFTVLPSNARLQTGTPPPGTPNYFLSSWEFTNGLTVYKFHVDWTSPLLSTFTGPDIPIAATSWPNAAVPNALSSGGNALDVLQIRAMVQNQYTNIGGVESLWATHTVRRGNTSGLAAPRYYQVNVTGGTVAAAIPQASTWDPDGANVISRFMPSVAVDRVGNMALGYSTSSSTTFPAIKYAGRLATDPINTLSQTEQVLIQGTGTQTGSCGGTCIRWGDYSAMTLDPDGCTFWYTNMYYGTSGLSFLTRIGSFSYPSCTPVGAGGTVQGTVTATVGGAPISGATVALGSRTTTTDGSGNYSFTGIPAGTYPSITASFSGYISSTVTSIVVTDGGTTTQDFSLGLAATNGCLVDTTQADFLGGVPTNVDLTSSPGDITLLNAPTVDQQNTAGTTTGTGFGTPNWTGQTFIPAVTATLVKVEVQLFCSGCTGTTPNLTLSVRATSAGLPTGADLATATIPGFSSPTGVHYTATFGSPATLTSGTQYALILRPNTAPSAGGYFWIRSSPSTYANGQRVLSSDSGTTWSADSTRDFNFKVFLQTGFASSGTFVSSTKDSNPSGTSTANWGTLSWTASTPANTAIQFQAAASNSVSGPFNFVGSDGTAATFFSNGGSLAQFNGSRYLKYKALLSTTDSTVTPTVNDVTICFVDTANTTLAVATATGTFGGTADLSATLSSSSGGVSGKTVTFTLNGTPAGSGTTDGSGVATVSAASLVGINAGSYPSGVAAAFAGDSGFGASSGTSALTVSMANQTISFGALGGKIFGDADFAVSATASSGLTVTFATGGNCTVAGSTVHITGAGSCTVTASQLGDSNYNAAPDVPQTFSIAKADQTITFGALSTKTPVDPDFAVSATASSGLTVTFASSGNCTIAGSTVHITGVGSCTITASQAGDTNYNAAPDVPQTFSITTATQTITFGALGAKIFGDADFLVSATASSGLTVGFAASGNCTVLGSTVHITAAGSCTITASQPGDSNYNPAPDVPQTFSIAKADQTITFGALAGKIFGDADFAVSATASSSLTVTFAPSGNCTLAGSTVHITGAGSCTITASQTGNANYNAAPDVPQSFSIAKANQTITFGALGAKNFGDADFAVSATASSSLTVTFAASGNCTVAGSTVHITGAGSCTVTASQAGNTNVNAAADVPQSFTINKAAPLVTVSCPGAGFDGNPHACTAAVTGIGSVTVSGATAITYNSSSTAPTNAGTYAVSASFTSGDANYADATGSGSLVIAKAIPTVTVTCPGGVIFDGSPHACTAAATGVASVAVTGASTLTYNGGAAPSNGGTYAVVASFTSGDANYADTTGSGSLTIGKASQTITFAVLPAKTFGNPDFSVSATASSTLAVSFTATGNCTVAGSTVHLTGAGSCTITAAQAGNANFNAAINVPRTFVINPGDDFAIAPTLPSVSVTAGQTVTDHITVTPNPATLTSLTFTCSGLPAKSTCTFAPNPVPPGASPTDVVLTITTTASTTAALERPRTIYAAWLGFASMGLVGVVMLGAGKKRRKRAVVLGAFALMVVLMSIGCGGKHTPVTTPGTPQGTSTVTVTGATTGFTHSTTFTLTVN